MSKFVYKRLNFISDERGMALATVMLIMLALSLMGTALLVTSMREMNISLKSEGSNQAFHVAEAGIDYAINKVLDGEILADYPDTTVTFGAGEFVVSIDREVDFSQTPSQATYSITSTGIVEDSQSTGTSWLPSLINKVIPVAFAANNQKTLNVEMKQTDPFTKYVFFMDEKQDPDSYNFVSYKKSSTYYHDEVTGSVHANGHSYSTSTSTHDLSIYSVANGYPIFNGLVSYVNGINVNGTVYDNDKTVPGPYFDPNYDPNPDEVTVTVFPESNDEMSLREYADKSLEIIDAFAFGSDVMVEISGNSLSINGGSPITLQNGNNILVVENGDILLSSSSDLDGRLTLVSVDGDIEISSNIQYKDKDLDSTILADPENEISDDILGLIAENDIVILGSAPDNISIDAIMLAKTGSIWYEDWNGMKGKSAKGTITVNGSLIQKTDFGDVLGTGKGKHFGYTSGMGGSKAGYYKKLNYDNRLNYIEPPYFLKPDRSLYEITWRQGK